MMHLSSDSEVSWCSTALWHDENRTRTIGTRRSPDKREDQSFFGKATVVLAKYIVACTRVAQFGSLPFLVSHGAIYGTMEAMCLLVGLRVAQCQH